MRQTSLTKYAKLQEWFYCFGEGRRSLRNANNSTKKASGCVQTALSGLDFLKIANATKTAPVEAPGVTGLEFAIRISIPSQKKQHRLTKSLITKWTIPSPEQTNVYRQQKKQLSLIQFDHEMDDLRS